jgi:hypothetical protein
MAYMPPSNNRKVRALKIGTVKLSTPKGENTSTTVATEATAKIGRSTLETESENIAENNVRLMKRQMKLVINIAMEPSKLLLDMNLEVVFPHLSPTIAAILSPYDMGMIPAAITRGFAANNIAKKVYEIA